MQDLASQSRTGLQVDAWSEAFDQVARHYGLPASVQSARLSGLWQQGRDPEARIKALAKGFGLRLQKQDPATAEISGARLPLILTTQAGEILLLTAIGADQLVSFRVSGEKGLENRQPLSALLEQALHIYVPRPANAAPDARVDSYIRPYHSHWLRDIFLKDKNSYSLVLILTVVMNLLALVTVLFSMQVYDRVVPAQSYPTLYVLFFGVTLGLAFEFAFRRLRMAITDLLGKRVDMRMSDLVFGHALRVRSQKRPTSTGTFISQIRDLEHVREVVSSTTVSAVADIPFFLLFAVVFWYIGGSLVWVPLVAIVLLLLPSLLAQRKLRDHARESMRESALRNAMLVETVQGLEDIKSLQAEFRFQHQWNHYNAVTGEAQLKLRSLTNGLTSWAGTVQNMVYASIIFVGAPMVMEGDLTTGTLVAASILGSRMMAPMSSFAQVLNRFQQAKMGVGGLDELMALPIDTPTDATRLHAPYLAGKYQIRDAKFAHPGEDNAVALNLAKLDIKPGEKIAVLGRNGAGKSTLLQALSGLMIPTSGEILLDDMAMGHIDPADVRRDVCLLSQNSRLFYGSIRENLLLGAPQATEVEIQQALDMSGALDFVRRNKAGLDYPLREGGLGLSGGQVQSLLLARLILRSPNVVLLDEPTAAMDDVAERAFIQKFRPWAEARTVVISTHRLRILELVDRIIVLQNGRITHDADKATVLGAMQGKAKA